MRYASLLMILAGCSDGGDGPSDATRASWALTLKVDGTDVKVPLQMFNVYLAGDASRPELFEFEGPGVTLVGEFPPDVRVDYGEKWERLFGKTVAISRTANLKENPESHVTLPNGTVLKVLGGTFVAEKLTGTMAGSKGDRTLHGRMSLQAEGRTIEGTFAVLAVTWG